MNTYAVRVKHDTGKVTITIAAASYGMAAILVMLAEKCPERAITRIERLS